MTALPGMSCRVRRTMSCRCRARCKVIDSTTQPIPASETGYKEFHLPAPAKGRQPGTYLVTLYLNGDSAEAKTFAVRK